MLLHFLGKSKVRICGKSGEKWKNASVFICTRFNAKTLLTYYLLICFSIYLQFNIFWNSKRLCVIKPKFWQCDYTPGTWNSMTSDTDNTFSSELICGHWKALTSIQETAAGYGVSSSSQFINHWCITLTNWSRACWMFGVAWTRASLTMQSTSCVGIFRHVFGYAYSLRPMDSTSCRQARRWRRNTLRCGRSNNSVHSLTGQRGSTERARDEAGLKLLYIILAPVWAHALICYKTAQRCKRVTVTVTCAHARDSGERWSDVGQTVDIGLAAWWVYELLVGEQVPETVLV